MIEKVDISEDSKDRQVFSEIARVTEANKLEVRRLEQINELENKRLEQVSELNFQYLRRLTKAEKRRLDAIRVTDVTALTTATERASLQAQVLARNVSESAETLRQLVATTANSVAEQLKQISTQLADRLLIVEKAQYELKGKTAVEDPQKYRSSEEAKDLKELLLAHINATKGTGEGRKEMYGWIFGGVTFIILVITFLIQFL